jgi:hypothetical protein
MPLYEFVCPKGHYEERLLDIEDRDRYRLACRTCGESPMKRLPGGHGMLYFEEGRARQQDSLGDKPITSYAQQKREMRQRGLVETGDNVPQSVAKSPKSIGLKRHMEKDNKGRWI